jgi:hypothetical protein
MSAGWSMKINSLPAKSGFCKNLTKKQSQQLFSIFSIVGTLNGLIWWNKKKFEHFHLTWDTRFSQAVALKDSYMIDENQTWKGHVQNIKPYLTRKIQILINIYNSITKTHFDYCGTAWMGQYWYDAKGQITWGVFSLGWISTWLTKLKFLHDYMAI